MLVNGPSLMYYSGRISLAASSTDSQFHISSFGRVNKCVIGFVTTLVIHLYNGKIPNKIAYNLCSDKEIPLSLLFLGKYNHMFL